MSNPNPDFEALERLCPEGVELAKEALAVKMHFESITTMRKLPGILERVHKTELRSTIGEILAIAACIVRLGKEKEKLETELSEDEKDVDVAYKQGKTDGYQMGYDDGAAALPRS